jgi:hypothetical protein
MPRNIDNKENDSLLRNEKKDDLPGTSEAARNPNPAANDNVNEEPSSKPDTRSNQVGSEITDGEDA